MSRKDVAAKKPLPAGKGVVFLRGRPVVLVPAGESFSDSGAVGCGDGSVDAVAVAAELVGQVRDGHSEIEEESFELEERGDLVVGLSAVSSGGSCHFFLPCVVAGATRQ